MDEVTDKTAATFISEPQEPSKNALKKAAKQEKMAASKSESKRAQPKSKKIEGAKLIGIDVAKEDDFSSWYQQVLSKGDFLDYYDVSGCYILKVRVTRFCFKDLW